MGNDPHYLFQISKEIRLYTPHIFENIFRNHVKSRLSDYYGPDSGLTIMIDPKHEEQRHSAYKSNGIKVNSFFELSFIDFTTKLLFYYNPNPLCNLRIKLRLILYFLFVV